MSFFQNDGRRNLPGWVLGSGFCCRVSAASLFEARFHFIVNYATNYGQTNPISATFLQV